MDRAIGCQRVGSVLLVAGVVLLLASDVPGRVPADAGDLEAAAYLVAVAGLAFALVGLRLERNGSGTGGSS